MSDRNGKRHRRSGGSSTGELSPVSVWRDSKRPRILSKVHTTLHEVKDPNVKSARRNELSREEKAVLDELAITLTPRPKRYPTDIGKGLPSQPLERPTQVFDRMPTVSHMIRKLEKLNKGKKILVSDTEEEGELEDIPFLPSKSKTAIPTTSNAEEEEPAIPAPSNAEEEEPTNESDDGEGDSDWVSDDDATGTGSSDMYSVVDESLGYVTSEDGSLLGEVVNDAILEATLENLQIRDYHDLPLMDRARKRNLLQNTSLATLRRLQLKKLIDEIDVGAVLLDRLEQDLRRMMLNATSVLRMMELTDTVISGSFVYPVLSRGVLTPNDLDLITTLKTFGMVLSYFKKKGYVHCKEVYPQGSRRATYASNLADISLIYELRNKKGFKINVIVSQGRPILPILQFHSTPVMNYIAYHGIVCLYDITLHQFGIINYVDPTMRVVRCITKYEGRGIEISDRLEDEHTCKIDGCCAQTIRSLFDRDVIHVRFPDSTDIPHAQLRKSEADIAVWRLATGSLCKASTNDDAGFVLCDSHYTGKLWFRYHLSQSRSLKHGLTSRAPLGKIQVGDGRFPKSPSV